MRFGVPARPLLPPVVGLVPLPPLPAVPGGLTVSPGALSLPALQCVKSSRHTGTKTRALTIFEPCPTGERQITKLSENAFFHAAYQDLHQRAQLAANLHSRE